MRRKPENPKERWPKTTTTSTPYQYDAAELKKSHEKWRKEFGLSKKK
ncbi:MAG: hypothetical protein QXN55_00640 [Candidatus Nitrosotenuis sp.]